jgi:hypothetical protein
VFQSIELPILQDLQCVAGSSFSFPFFIGQPTSGYGFSGYVDIPVSGLGHVPFTIENNDQQNGGISLNLASTATSTFPGGTYPWQFQFTDLNSFVTTWFQGTFLVLGPA